MPTPSIEQAFDLALERHRAGRLADAQRLYRSILEHQPSHSDALHLLGVVALQTGDLERALELVDRAVDLQPHAAIYRNSRGQILEKTGRYGEAEAEYVHAIALDSDYAEAHNNLGHLLTGRDRLAEAEAECRAAIRLDPGYAEPHTNLGNTLKARGQLDAAIAEYRRAIELRPDLSFLHSNLLLTLHYHADYSPADLAREHRLWADRHVAPLAAGRLNEAHDLRPDRRLRIGYVSPDFREHAVTRFILPILEKHDREQFEIVAYSDVTRPDDVTRRVRGVVDTWRDVASLTDAQLTERIVADRVDLLVDLAAHSARNRLLVFARKPAPVQVTYLAYCSTTGVDAIDYRLTDRFLDPPDTDLSHYAERTIRLPDCYWCYSAPELPADRRPPTDRLPGPPTFGCLNNFAKINDRVLDVWTRILARVPEARLLLHSPPGSHRERVRTRVASAGLPPSAVTFVGRQPLAEYLATYREVDVALDPFPYTGGTTTCDALWMGVPVVTLAGTTAVSRGGSSLLSNVGLAAFVAGSEDRYVELAAELIGAKDRPASARSDLRRRLEGSPIMDAARFVRGLESAYRGMWQAFCQRR